MTTAPEDLDWRSAQAAALAADSRQRIAETAERDATRHARAFRELNRVTAEAGHAGAQREMAEEHLQQVAALVELGDADEGQLALAERAVDAADRALRRKLAAMKGLRAAAGVAV